MLRVLDIPIYDKDIQSAITEICSETGATQKKPKLISATGAHGLVEAARCIEFKKLLTAFYWNLPDGMPLVWIAKLKGVHQIQRCYGPDFFAGLMAASSQTDLQHFFCGGKPGVADELLEVCQNKYSNDRVVGTFCPPFREITEPEMEALGQQINETGAHIVWIGLGTPKQEKFAFRLSNYVQADYIITVGAAFDFHTGRLKQAPKWIQMAGLEWFYRLMIEPKRLWKRYVRVVPLFICLNIKEFVDLTFKRVRK